MFQITLNNKLFKKSLLINVHDIYPKKLIQVMWLKQNYSVDRNFVVYLQLRVP
jgi:hypothetical protein